MGGRSELLVSVAGAVAGAVVGPVDEAVVVVVVVEGYVGLLWLLL